MFYEAILYLAMNYVCVSELIYPKLNRSMQLIGVPNLN